MRLIKTLVLILFVVANGQARNSNLSPRLTLELIHTPKSMKQGYVSFDARLSNHGFERVVFPWWVQHDATPNFSVLIIPYDKDDEFLSNANLRGYVPRGEFVLEPGSHIDLKGSFYLTNQPGLYEIQAQLRANQEIESVPVEIQVERGVVRVRTKATF